MEVLAGFAEKRGVIYPLLSDEGSHTIRALGLYNEHLAEQHAVYGVGVRDEQIGVSYPGIFVLDEQGIIVEKRFEQSYRTRPTPAVLVEDLIGVAAAQPAVLAQAEREGVTISAWLGSATYRPFQKLRLHVSLRMAEGIHVYGTPIPEDYVPLEITVEPFDGLSADTVEMPEAHAFRMEGVDEAFVVYEGEVSAAMTLAIVANQGQVTLQVRVRYQACTESFCYMPEDVLLELPVEGLENIRD